MTPPDATIIEGIRAKIASGDYEFSRHATSQSILRNIKVEEVEKAIQSGEVIEDYPDDKYGPSCLILGFTDINDGSISSAAILRGLWSKL